MGWLIVLKIVVISIIGVSIVFGKGHQLIFEEVSSGLRFCSRMREEQDCCALCPSSVLLWSAAECHLECSVVHICMSSIVLLSNGVKCV